MKGDKKNSEQENVEEKAQSAQENTESTKDTATEEVDRVTELEIELAEQKDKFLRIYSEYENHRRRTAKEKLDLMKTASQDVLSALLPVIDDFERAKKSMQDASDVKPILEGIELVYGKLINTVNQQGLKAFDSIGEVFDADLHEAVTKIPAPSKDMKGKVVDEIEKGYKLNDKVVRYAKVVVGE